MKQTVRAFKHRARTHETGLGQAHRAVARLRCPTGVHALGPRTIGQVFDDAAGHAASQAQGVDHLRFADAHGRAHRHHRAHRTKDGGGMKAGFVHLGGGDGTQAAHHFHAMSDAAQHIGSAEGMSLRGGEHHGHDDRTGVHRATFVGVVKVLSVGRDPVDKSSTFGAQADLMTDGGARACAVQRSQRSRHIRLVAGSQANPHHIQQQAFGRATRRGLGFGVAGGHRM